MDALSTMLISGIHKEILAQAAPVVRFVEKFSAATLFEIHFSWSQDRFGFAIEGGVVSTDLPFARQTTMRNVERVPPVISPRSGDNHAVPAN